jgi:GH15 family glucan-1,4-alpha-glucosidase
MAATDYKDLEDYGIIGNLETCALVGRDGSIDWLCFPYLESPSLFAALLDAERGGHFWTKPLTKYESIAAYIENTNILQTTFITALGTVAITDFMPVEDREETQSVRVVFRKVEWITGEVELEISLKLRFDYARAVPDLELVEDGIACRWKDESLFLQAPIRLQIQDGEARGVISGSAGETAWFALQYNHHAPLQPEDMERLLKKTEKFWRGWAHQCESQACIFAAPWHDLVVRAGLVLKLLANPETGAIAAAPTTSLPERIGGVRNWDYRYAWIRDAALTVQALFHLGHMKEWQDFRRWIEAIMQRAKEDPSRMEIMYGLHGEADLEERILDHLGGYKDSSPVRIGNAAAQQRQHDIYGELLNVIYETTRYGVEVSEELWEITRDLVHYVCQVWDTQDSGIWEVRGGPRHFVYSKLMCWVALDRGIKIARVKSFDAPVEEWEKVREEIRQAILEKGFSKKLNSFVQAFDAESLDATSLLIPLMGFLPFDDPRVQGTIDATLKGLVTKNGLVNRYEYEAEDGLPGREGSFALCSFWLIKALAASGRMGEAEETLLNVLNYVTPLGLLAEEIDPSTGKQLGNYPQAFSHIGLINSALYLGVAKGREHKGPKPMGLSAGEDNAYDTTRSSI